MTRESSVLGRNRQRRDVVAFGIRNHSKHETRSDIPSARWNACHHSLQTCGSRAMDVPDYPL